MLLVESPTIMAPDAVIFKSPVLEIFPAMLISFEITTFPVPLGLNLISPFELDITLKLPKLNHYL